MENQGKEHFSILDYLGESLNNSGIEIIGPITTQDSEWFSRIYDFRVQELLKTAPWLYSPEQIEIENKLELDHRSYHFVALMNSEIVATIRYTPNPWEMCELHPVFDSMKIIFPHHFEISRLVTKTDAPLLPLIARQLLFRSGKWLYEMTDAEGLIAICRENRLKFFKRFGFESQLPFGVEILSRPGSLYHVVESDWKKMFTTVEEFKKTDDVHRRLLQAKLLKRKA